MSRRGRLETLEARRLLAADPVLDWNWIALEAVKNDHSLAQPDAGGPTMSSLALGVVHAAIFDAVNAIDGRYKPYLLPGKRPPGARLDAAVAAAAYATLVEYFPQQKDDLDAAFQAYLDDIPDGPAQTQGLEVGFEAADRILTARENDGRHDDMTHELIDEPGHHQVDPLHPDQGFLTPKWGKIQPFAMTSGDQFRAPPPPPLDSSEYAAAYHEAMVVGALDAETSDRDGNGLPDRTPEQTQIGLFWAYDGSPGLGTPPRMYNQIVRVIAQQQENTVVQNARLFALVNVALADAGIASWESKYEYDFWRPIVAIRQGELDGNDATPGDPDWRPLGAPASNSGDPHADFTPPFPAYTSGHATFGAAAFRTVARFYETDEIAFEFQSDELNGVTRGADGQVRPEVTRRFERLSDAAWENALSRIYLGIHWKFDAVEGVRQGTAVADYVFDKLMQPKARHNRELPSDVDGDGGLGMSDVVATVEQLRHKLEHGDLDPEFAGFCDVNGDERLTVLDVVMVVEEMRRHLPEGEAGSDAASDAAVAAVFGMDAGDLHPIVPTRVDAGTSVVSRLRQTPQEASQREPMVPPLHDPEIADRIWGAGDVLDNGELDRLTVDDPFRGDAARLARGARPK